MTAEIERVDVGLNFSLSLDNIRHWSGKFGVLAVVYAVIAGWMRVEHFGFYTLIDIVLNVVLDVTATHAALQWLHEADYGRKARIAGPLGLAIVCGVAETVGLLFLIVPGVILYVGWSVSLPAMLCEKLGILGALGRSWDLTRGNRLRLFVLACMLTIPVLFLSSFLTRMGDNFVGSDASGNLLFQVVVHLMVGVASLFAAVSWTEAYVTLAGRNDRGNRLADIFA